MQQGILERIESKLDELLSRGTPVLVEGDGSGEALPEIPQTQAATEAPDLPDLSGDAPVATESSVELDSDGVPWDERIHSSSKKRGKGGTGPWNKRRGVNDALYKQVTEELKAAQASGNGSVGAANGSAGVPAPSNTPPPPPATSTTKPPMPPVAQNSAPPPPSSASSNDRQMAVDAINGIIERHNVNVDAITQYYIDNFNVTTFEEIPAESYVDICGDMEDWSNRLDIVAENVAELKIIYAADVTVIEPYIIEQCNKATLLDRQCTHYTDVALDRLEKVEKGIGELLASCQSV